MKRLFLPFLLVIASLLVAAIVTTVTAVALSSYSPGDQEQNNSIDKSISVESRATVLR